MWDIDTMSKGFVRRKQTPAPAVVEDGVTRGQMLSYIFSDRGLTLTAVEKATSIPRRTLNRWVHGETDLAKASHAHAHALITFLRFTNEQIWAIMNIPVDDRINFRADQAVASIDAQLLHLDSPLYGEVILPAGATLRYASGGQGDFQLIRLRDGTYYAVRSAADLTDAEVLGTLLGVSFASAATPTPDDAALQN